MLNIELELEAPSSFEGRAVTPAYALYDVCEDVHGTCLFRRRDVELVVEAQ